MKKNSYHIDRILQLLLGELTGELSKEEYQQLQEWLMSSPDNMQLYRELKEDEMMSNLYHEQKQFDTGRALVRIHERMQKGKVRIWRQWLPYVAAALLLIFTAISWIFLRDSVEQDPDAMYLTIQDIRPGGNKGTLTLSDGRVVDLSENQSGIVIDDEIRYLDGSEVLNLNSRNKAKDKISYVTLATPKGGMYQITLSDGSRVWLNAASKLKYPIRFEGKDRVVELEGEAYFEVNKQQAVKKLKTSQVPFKVLTKGQLVEVLGTEFNISAYEDEIKTTLLEGGVKVENLISKDINVLSPGEQTILKGETSRVDKVDVAQYTAWKDGRFHFYRTPFNEVLSQISRWYDVDIRYEGKVPQETFTGRMGRELSLQAVLDVLGISDADIRLENRILIIH